MNDRPARDRLAVWTYTEHGEEIPCCGDPSVTDAERAAAGRETLAELSQAVLPRNRSRAARQYSAGGLPGGEDMVRVWSQRDPAALRARLGEAPLVAWAEDDVLHVLWRGTADAVTLAAGVQPQPWPVTTWPPGRSSPGSGRRPGNGRSACSAPGSPAATGSGSVAMTASGGTSSCPPPWPGCWFRLAADTDLSAETGTAVCPGQAVSYRWPESAGPCRPGSSTRWCTFG